MKMGAVKRVLGLLSIVLLLDGCTGESSVVSFSLVGRYEKEHELYYPGGRVLKSFEYQELKELDSVHLNFNYDNEVIRCDLNTSETLFTSTVLEKLDISEVPKSFINEDCALTFLNPSSFDGVVLSKGKILHFHTPKGNTMEVQTSINATCLTRLHDETNSTSSNSLRGLADDPFPLMNRALRVDRWKNCYPGDDSGKILKVGFAIGRAMQKLFDSKKELYSFVQSVVEDANIIYKKQLNIKLMVGDIVLADGQKWDTCGYKLSDKLMLLSQWKKPSFQGMWHLFDDCVGVRETSAGMAWIGTLCSKYNTAISYCVGVDCSAIWRIFAHEAGHNFGADHSFEEGVGTTGGIMDYGDGTLKGKYQFNSRYRKNEICKVLESTVDSCEAFNSLGSDETKEVPPTKSPTTYPTPYPSILSIEASPCIDSKKRCEDLEDFEISDDSSVCVKTKWISSDDKCLKKKDFFDAKDACESIGARLCTYDELKRQLPKGSGCNFDRKYAWSSTFCDSIGDKYWAVKNKGLKEACVSGSEKQTNGNNLVVRCCADKQTKC